VSSIRFHQIFIRVNVA